MHHLMWSTDESDVRVQYEEHDTEALLVERINALERRAASLKTQFHFIVIKGRQVYAIPDEHATIAKSARQYSSLKKDN